MEKWWVFALSMVLAGALRAWLRSKGWWPDWEERARQRREEKQLVRAYKKWRKNARPGEAADARIFLHRLANGSRDLGPVDDSTS